MPPTTRRKSSVDLGAVDSEALAATTAAKKMSRLKSESSAAIGTPKASKGRRQSRGRPAESVPEEDDAKEPENEQPGEGAPGGVVESSGSGSSSDGGR